MITNSNCVIIKLKLLTALFFIYLMTEVCYNIESATLSINFE